MDQMLIGQGNFHKIMDESKSKSQPTFIGNLPKNFSRLF